jgi:saccharopine dehydrogenase-like NADP-dependent oxidoreductase
MTKKIFIAGSGGIGEAVALLLREWCVFDVELFLGDISEEGLRRAKDFVAGGSSKTSNITTVLMASDAVTDEMQAAFDACDVLLDCSPGGQAPRMARFAKDHKMHYANLTEYVAETDEIIELAKDAETGFILQTGLAPGFINVLAMSLYKRFVEQYQNENVERIGMKVGALTENAHAPHFYGFTWSPIGVATEYVKNSRIIRDGAIVEQKALTDRERIIIDSRTFEADLTSGGAADLPDHFNGKAQNLDYKTLRYVGHYDWVDGLVKKMDNEENVPKKLEEIMLREVPSVEDDIVLVHSSVEGFDSNGRRRMLEKAYEIKPLTINGKSVRAIQTTTAAPLCEAAMMLLTGRYKGVVLQSQIDPKEFMSGTFITKVYGE